MIHFHLMRMLGLSVIVLASGCSLSGLDAYSSQYDASTPQPDASVDAPIDVVPPKDVAVEATIDAAPQPCKLGSPFVSPAPVTALNTNNIDFGAALSPDQLTVYFGSDRLSQGANVFTASRPDVTSAFGAIAPLASLNYSGADTWNVTLTADLKTAYLVTDQGAADNMYKATRASSLVAFNLPTKMPQPVVNGRQPYVLPDGSALYYSDSTTKKLARTPLPTLAPQAINLTVPGGKSYGIPVVNASETIMYFSVWDEGVFGSYDIWVTTRATSADAWGTPVPVTELNTVEFDTPSWISADGCTFYYTHAPASGANWDIWVAKKPP